jgi:hypothetical protein
VTQFTIKAYPIGKVWGGTRVYDESKTEELYKAMHEFIPYSNEDPKAAIIVTSLILTGGSKLNLLFYFYDGEKPPTSGPFADLLKIKTTLSTTKTQSYPDLVCQQSTRGLRSNVTNILTSSNRTEQEFRC